MSEINLLPQEFKPGSTVIKLSTNIKKIALLGVVIFLISVISYFTSFLFLNQRISVSLSNQEKLKNQIKALEKTEQRLVLVKDRLDKISSINRNPRANDEVGRLNIVSALFPENTFVEEIELDEHNAAVAISSDNLDKVASYLASVISSGEYVKVNLDFLQFDPKNGYIIGLAFPE